MDPTVTLVEYIGFVVAALILIWAVIEVSRRFYSRGRLDTRGLHTWVRLDSTSPTVVEEPVPAVEDDQEEATEADFHTRARQNGHYSESKKPL